MFFLLSLIAATWFDNIIWEATFYGYHTKKVQKGIKFGMILFITSEIMLFFSFFWAFFHSSIAPAMEIGCVWPPKGIDALSPWAIPLLNTMILLTSGASLTWAHAALVGGYRLETITGLLFTIVLAVFFTACQGYEYLNAPFSISDSVYGTTFYMLTGLHGFHVIIGTLFIIVALYRFVVHHYTTERHIGFECAAWYWHFVDVVWIFLFLVVYSWGDSV
jgi:cytochrome c oxidase subunit 3